jgi:hypothetical protein
MMVAQLLAAAGDRRGSATGRFEPLARVEGGHDDLDGPRMAPPGGLWTFAPDFLRELSDCAAVAGAAVRKS